MKNFGKKVRVECDFCADVKDSKRVAVSNLDDAEVSLDNDNDLSFIYYGSSGVDYLFVSINYCPMCGRKLEEDECYTEMNLDRTAIEELGKHFGKGFDIGLKNIAIGNTQEEIDKMVNALKDGEHFIRGRGRERFEKQ